MLDLIPVFGASQIATEQIDIDEFTDSHGKLRFEKPIKVHKAVVSGPAGSFDVVRIPECGIVFIDVGFGGIDGVCKRLRDFYTNACDPTHSYLTEGENYILVNTTEWPSDAVEGHFSWTASIAYGVNDTDLLKEGYCRV